MSVRAFVFIRPADNYYARYEERICTHAFETQEPLTQYWVELVRTNPRLLEEQMQ